MLQLLSTVYGPKDCDQWTKSLPNLLEAGCLFGAVAEGQNAVRKSTHGVDAEQQDGYQRCLPHCTQMMIYGLMPSPHGRLLSRMASGIGGRSLIECSRQRPCCLPSDLRAGRRTRQHWPERSTGGRRV